MNRRIVRYLEEYHRSLMRELEVLVECQEVDHDKTAGDEAGDIILKMHDIKRIVKVLLETNSLE